MTLLSQCVEAMLIPPGRRRKERRLKYGPNFCIGGAVCLGGASDVEHLVRTPSDRTTRLATVPVKASRLPGTDRGQRAIFGLVWGASAGGLVAALANSRSGTKGVQFLEMQADCGLNWAKSGGIRAGFGRNWAERRPNR